MLRYRIFVRHAQVCNHMSASPHISLEWRKVDATAVERQEALERRLNEAPSGPGFRLATAAGGVGGGEGGRQAAEELGIAKVRAEVARRETLSEHDSPRLQSLLGVCMVKLAALLVANAIIALRALTLIHPPPPTLLQTDVCCASKPIFAACSKPTFGVCSYHSRQERT